MEFDAALAKFDLQFTLEDAADAGMSGTLTYATDLFDASTATEFADRFVSVLRGVVANPAAAVGDVDVMSACELDRVLSWSDTGVDSGVDSTLSAWFDDAAARFGDRVAVRFGGESLSYGELSVRANRLARRLIAQGCGQVVGGGGVAAVGGSCGGVVGGGEVRCGVFAGRSVVSG
ncbi:condensation domain-containing protein [Rhodococcus sp. 3Y1]